MNIAEFAGTDFAIDGDLISSILIGMNLVVLALIVYSTDHTRMVENNKAVESIFDELMVLEVRLHQYFPLFPRPSSQVSP